MYRSSIVSEEEIKCIQPLSQVEFQAYLGKRCVFIYFYLYVTLAHTATFVALNRLEIWQHVLVVIGLNLTHTENTKLRPH